MPSLTVENYVKTIHQISASQGDGLAATGELAAALGVSPGTVTSMLKTLSEAHLAIYTPYEGVSLTESGKTLAVRVIRRHRLIEFVFDRLQVEDVHKTVVGYVAYSGDDPDIVIADHRRAVAGAA